MTGRWQAGLTHPDRQERRGGLQTSLGRSPTRQRSGEGQQPWFPGREPGQRSGGSENRTPASEDRKTGQTGCPAGADGPADLLCGRRLGPGPYDRSKTPFSLPALSCPPAAFSVGNSSGEKDSSRLEALKPVKRTGKTYGASEVGTDGPQLQQFRALTPRWPEGVTGWTWARQACAAPCWCLCWQSSTGAPESPQMRTVRSQ